MKNRRKKLLIYILLCALGASAVFVGLNIRVYRMPTGAMEPTFREGESVIYERLSKAFRTPMPGEVVFFRLARTDEATSFQPPLTDEAYENVYAMRVAAVAGERISIRDGRIYVNGQTRSMGKDRKYVNLSLAQFLPNTQSHYVVSDGCIFLLGDNSNTALDSRFWGSLPVEQIVGYPISKP
ncbi:MAG: signal peptidase I [Verrucomicrobiaceae bacterium]